MRGFGCAFFILSIFMVCCEFGHKEIFQNIGNRLDEAIAQSIDFGCSVFYTGAMGEFDSLFSSAVRIAKKTHPEIKLICIKPYLTKELNENKDYYSAMFDDVIIPTDLMGIHYKTAIKARNRWIVDNSDVVIGYIIRDYGGAYTAIKYAEKKNKKIILINKFYAQMPRCPKY